LRPNLAQRRASAIHLRTRPHVHLPELRPHIRAALAASRASEVGLDVGQPNIIASAASVGLDVVAASVIAAIDQHIANAGLAHLAEGDFFRVGRHVQTKGWQAADILQNLED
jgi:hypothetical protein